MLHDANFSRMAGRNSGEENKGSPPRYRAPADVRTVPLADILAKTGREPLEDKQLALLRAPDAESMGGVSLYYSGDLTLLERPCVAIVGSRSASTQGIARASRLSRELVENGCVVVSGLALGIDNAAHTSAIAAGGHTIAVIGTPLDKAYPAEHAALQEQIYSHHLLVSPFRSGERTFRSNFPKRNRVMASVTDATVIVEASDTSGTIHQAAECVRLGRWLFIAKSLVDNSSLEWPRKFLKNKRTAVLSKTSDVVDVIMAVRD